MAVIIDRRENPGGKSVPNRQRYLKRAEEEVREAINRQIRNQKVSDEVGKNGKVKVRGSETDEPFIVHDPKTGDKTYVVPGNRTHTKGDKIPKPPPGAGQGAGNEPGEGDSEDEFQFLLTQDEFLDILFADLELPDLIKTMLKDATIFKPKRAGFTVAGNPSALNVRRTMRNARGRAMALRRPSQEDIRVCQEALDEALVVSGGEDSELVLELRGHLEVLLRRSKGVPYVDPLDVRYNRFEMVPDPNTSAVVFALMDVSGSMDETKKDLAKRFFILLHLFLTRNYDRVDVVFIKHTDRAREVTEDDFFHSRESGGTKVSSALEELMRVQKERYPVDEWNIYVAQASDGDNGYSDDKIVMDLMNNQVLPMVQYFAYIETRGVHSWDAGTSDLWDTYKKLESKRFQMRQVRRQEEIFGVLADLFKKADA